MITVLPSKNIDEISALFQKHSLETTTNSGCVIARNGEEVLGYCLYELYEKGITVREIEPKDDLSLADGVLRSALHVAAERSAMDARYADSAPEDIFQKLDFIINADEKTLNINKLFGGCNCDSRSI